MTRTLIANGHVFTVDPNRHVYEAGFVVVDETRITAVGAASEAPGFEQFDHVIDATGCIVTPGLINMHQHHWYTLFKGLADGLLLEDWVTEILLPLSHQLDAEAMRVASYVAGMEMLATGTTCSFNHSVTTTTAETVKASIEPQAELGIRQVYAKELRCRTPGNPNHALNLDEALAQFEEEVRRWNGKHDGLVRFGMAIESNAHWVAAGMSTEQLICQGHAFARQHDLKITAHISGGTFSLEQGFLKYLRETGRTDVRYLMQLGILDPQWVLIHGIHATELDIEQMARVGCSFVYTPTSEAIRGGGISPFANAHRAGVNVALGTDGPMVDYSVDMLEQMKVCTMMQHVRHLDPTRMPVETTLEMATINAAKALGLENEIGSLQPGKRADIAIFDVTKPYVGVLHRPLTSLVTAGRASDVRAVLVNGQTVYQEGCFQNLSEPAKVIAEAQKIGRGAIDRAGLGHRLSPAWRI